jgi:hypothetical protein
MSVARKKGQPVCVCARARERRAAGEAKSPPRCPRRARNSSAEVWQISALRETANAFWRPHVDLGGHSRSRFLTLGALGRQNRLSAVASTLLRKNLHHPTGCHLGLTPCETKPCLRCRWSEPLNTKVASLMHWLLKIIWKTLQKLNKQTFKTK